MHMNTSGGKQLRTIISEIYTTFFTVSLIDKQGKIERILSWWVFITTNPYPSTHQQLHVRTNITETLFYLLLLFS